jgi:hypothetical protein
LLKVREEKYEAWWGSREPRMCVSVLKTYKTYAKGGPGDPHSMINEWGGAGAVPDQVRAVP